MGWFASACGAKCLLHTHLDGLRAFEGLRLVSYEVLAVLNIQIWSWRICSLVSGLFDMTSDLDMEDLQSCERLVSFACRSGRGSIWSLVSGLFQLHADVWIAGKCMPMTFPSLGYWSGCTPSRPWSTCAGLSRTSYPEGN